MPIYTVHMPRAAIDPVARADRTAFVRDGFNIWAFVFGPLFLLRHRAWLAALIWLAIAIAGFWFVGFLHLPAVTRWLLGLLLELFLGFEGNNLRRLALDRRGFELADVVAGASREDSETRFFRAWQDQAPVPAAARSQPPAMPSRPYQGSEPIIGLFPSQNG